MKPLLGLLAGLPLLLASCSSGKQLVTGPDGPPKPADEAALAKSATLYFSFDQGLMPDLARGDPIPAVRVLDPKDPKHLSFKIGPPADGFAIRDQGVSGKCLEVTQDPGGWLGFPARDHLAYAKDGWGGAVSLWVNVDPDKLPKPWSAPILITDREPDDAALWIGFGPGSPRELRHGAFPALIDDKALSPDDPKAPVARLANPGFKPGTWHHLVMSWDRFDTGKPDAVSTFYVDGKKVGAVKDRALAMSWEINLAKIYFANYLDRLDELAVFERPLTADEVFTLHQKPGLLAGLKKK